MVANLRPSLPVDLFDIVHSASMLAVFENCGLATQFALVDNPVPQEMSPRPVYFLVCSSSTETRLG